MNDAGGASASIAALASAPWYRGQIAAVHIVPAREARTVEPPTGLRAPIRDWLRGRGIDRLYCHQAEAIRYSLQKRNVVLSTSTASGKSLAYQVPVLDRLFKDPSVRALFLFPVKALERDQRDAFNALAGDSGITVAVYDGDTPESERRKIRSRPPSILITNPDMLHLSILAYHDSWKELFANLSYVVLDEVHTYKGIFGSHVNQVILRRMFQSHTRDKCLRIMGNGLLENSSRRHVICHI